jgi:hypothetical protein
MHEAVANVQGNRAGVRMEARRLPQPQNLIAQRNLLAAHGTKPTKSQHHNICCVLDGWWRNSATAAAVAVPDPLEAGDTTWEACGKLVRCIGQPCQIGAHARTTSIVSRSMM